MKVLTRMLRNLFGVGTAETDEETQESDITVEREPATESEDAVKGTDTATDAEVEEDEPEAEAEEDEPEAEVEEDEPEAEAEEDEPEAEAEEVEEDEGSGDDATSVEELDGIGPTYRDRLENAGMGTIGALAKADAEAVAEAAQTSDSRAAEWIEQANDRV